MSRPAHAGGWQPPQGIARGATVARNVVAAYAGTIAEGFAFLLLTPFLIRRLGLEWFGLWTLAVTLIDWLQLLDFGLRDAVTKYAAAHQAQLDRPAIRRVVDTALVLYGVIGSIALAATLLFAWLGVPLVVDDPGQQGTLRAALLLLGTTAALSFPANLAGTLLEGLLRFDLINALRLGFALLRLVLIVIALQFGYGVVGVVVAEVAARLVLHVVRWSVIATLFPGLIPTPIVHGDVSARLFGFGAWNALRQVVEVACARLCEPLLAFFAGLPAVGAFYAGRRFASLPAEAIVPLAGVLIPLSSEFEAGGRSSALQESLLKTTKFAWSVSLPVALVLSLGAQPILSNWLGGRAPEAVAVLEVFAFVFLLVATSLPAESILLGLGRTRLLAVSGTVQAALTLGLGILLVQSFGAPGLASAVLIATFAAQVCVQIPVAARACGFTAATFAQRALVPGVLAGAPVAAAMFWLRGTLPVGGLAALAAWSGGAFLTYAGLFWLFGLDREEKQFLSIHARRLFMDPSESDPGA